MIEKGKGLSPWLILSEKKMIKGLAGPLKSRTVFMNFELRDLINLVIWF